MSKKGSCSPIPCLVAFTLCYIVLHLTINYFSQFVDFSRTEVDNEIISEIKQIVVECQGDYSISLLALKSNNPRMYNFKDVISYITITKEARSVKLDNDYYTKSHYIDNAAFNFIKNVKAGTVSTPSIKDLKQSATFSKAFNNSNSKIENLAFGVVKYFNGSIKYVVMLNYKSITTKCHKSDLVKTFERIIIAGGSLARRVG